MHKSNAQKTTECYNLYNWGLRKKSDKNMDQVKMAGHLAVIPYGQNETGLFHEIPQI